MTEPEFSGELEGRMAIEPATLTRAIMLASGAKTVAESAMLLSRENKEKRIILEHDIFGNPDRPGDRGFKGDMLDSFAKLEGSMTKKLDAQAKMDWTILMGVLALVAVLLGAYTGLIPHFGLK